jgi:hypothetical protein
MAFAESQCRYHRRFVAEDNELRSCVLLSGKQEKSDNSPLPKTIIFGIRLRSLLIRRTRDKQKGKRYRVEMGMKISLIGGVLMRGMDSHIDKARRGNGNTNVFRSYCAVSRHELTV